MQLSEGNSEALEAMKPDRPHQIDLNMGGTQHIITDVCGSMYA